MNDASLNTDVLAWGIEEIDPSVRVYNILKRNGVDNLGQILDITVNDLVEWHAKNDACTWPKRCITELVEHQDYVRYLVNHWHDR